MSEMGFAGLESSGQQGWVSSGISREEPGDSPFRLLGCSVPWLGFLSVLRLAACRLSTFSDSDPHSRS